MTELKKNTRTTPWEIDPDGGVEEAADSVAVAWKAMSFRKKCSYFMKNVTVEPTILLYFVPKIFVSLAIQNLGLEKACRVNLGYSDDVCTALTSGNSTYFKDAEIAVQQLVSGVQIWQSPIASAFPVVIILFVGAWSDRTGIRKPLMLFPILGEILALVSYIICTYWFYEIPMEVVGVLGSIWPALTGGWMAMTVGAFSYIIDATTPESRMIRIGILNVLISAGLPMGSALSGVLYVELGFYGVFGIATLCYVVAFLHCLIWIKEIPRPLVTKPEEKAKRSGCGSFIDVFAIRHISDTIKVLFTKGVHNRRIRIIFLMIIHMIIIGPSQGEPAVMYLFSRYQFNWNEVQYSIFSTYNMLANFAGMAVSIWLFSHVCKIDDAIVGVISCMSKILAALVYGFASTEWMMYLAPVVESVNGAAHTSMRSIASKSVPKHEQGKLSALFGVCDALMPMVYVPMYSSIYRATLDTLPGAFFLSGGALTVPAAILFLCLYTERRGDRAREPAEAAEEANKRTEKSNESSETSNVQ